MTIGEPAIFILQLANLVRPVDDQTQRIDVDGFLVEIVGAQSDCLDGIVLVTMACDHDDFRERSQTEDFFQRRETLADA